MSNGGAVNGTTALLGQQMEGESWCTAVAAMKEAKYLLHSEFAIREEPEAHSSHYIV